MLVNNKQHQFSHWSSFFLNSGEVQEKEQVDKN
jgi:hypothetical protein